MHKALTVKQPWAWLILHGGKDVENRMWPISYRGPLLIHAGKTYDDEADYFFDWAATYTEIDTSVYPTPDEIVYGAIIGRVQLVGCQTLYRSDWADDEQWNWILADPEPFAEPVPWCGRLGLWQISDEELRTGHELDAQLRMEEAAKSDGNN